MVSSKKIRISEDQKEKLLGFMYQHPDFATGRFVGAHGKQVKTELWQRLASILNADGRGACKSVEKWSRTWDDWRSKTKAKAAELEGYCQETEGGGAPGTKLSSLELRLLELIGGLHNGLGNSTVEAGFSKNEEFEAINYMVLDVLDTSDPEIDTSNLLEPSTSRSTNSTVPLPSIKVIKVKSSQKKPGSILISNVKSKAIDQSIFSKQPPSKCSFKGIPSTLTTFLQQQSPSQKMLRTVIEEFDTLPKPEEVVCAETHLKGNKGKALKKGKGNKPVDPLTNDEEYTDDETPCVTAEERKLEVFRKIGASMERMAVAMERKAKASMRKAFAMERIAKVKEAQLRLRGRKRK